MTGLDILRLRLENQLLQSSSMQEPAQVVSWLGAVQSQDFAGSKWALGLRIQGASDASVEQAFNAGLILRTHVLRPTWHFVSASDIRWMLDLTAPRVHAANAYYHRQLELDDAAFRRSGTALRKALKGGGCMTRTGLTSALEKAGIPAVGPRFALLIMHAELEGVICSGPRIGRQFSYMLLDERAPAATSMSREAALGELTRRYFASHGPATLHDFSWWSGLAMAAVRQGLEMVQSQLVSDTVDGQLYWVAAATHPAARVRGTWLLPNFDEYIVSYTDRHLFFDSSYDEGLLPRNSMLSNHTVVINGRVRGIWRRSLAADSVTVELSPFEPLTPAEKRGVQAAAQRYAAFLGLRLDLA
jgi:hypothetical protein